MSGFGVALDNHKMNLMRKAFTFFSKQLGIDNCDYLFANLDDGKHLSKGSDGVCSGRYYGYNLIKIQIYVRNTGSPIGMVDVLAHEMVHAWQHLSGNLGWIDKTYYRVNLFGLKLFPYTKKAFAYKGVYHDETSYYDRVCEQEAFTYGAMLLRLFIQEHESDLLLVTEENLGLVNEVLERATTKENS